MHLCGKRYVDRVEDITKITVYSNQPTVELFANGKSLGVREAADHFFYFEVPNVGETVLRAVAGACTDESRIRKVEVFNEDYRLKEQGAVLNWFDIETPEGYLSLNDKVEVVLKTPEGAAFFKKLMGSMEGKQAAGFEMSEDMMKMMNGFTVLRLTSMLGMMDISFTKEQLLEMNAELNKIKKEE